MKFKSGDAVFYRPNAEKFIVAVTQGDYLMPYGLSETIVLISDCDLIEECSAEESLLSLRSLAGEPFSNEAGGRAAIAYGKLLELGEIPYIRAYAKRLSQQLEANSKTVVFLIEELKRVNKISADALISDKEKMQ